jgi:hypothetical protein
MHDDDLLTALKTLRAELTPQAAERIVRYFWQLSSKLTNEVPNVPGSKRHLLLAIRNSLEARLTKLEETAELSEQPTGGHPEGGSPPAGPPLPSLPTKTPTEDDADQRDRIHDALHRIRRDLVADQAARRYLGELGGPAADAETLWRELHLATWRLPQAESQDWRDRLQRALGDNFGADAAPSLPSELDATVVPAVPALNWPGIFTRDTPPRATDEEQRVRGWLGSAADRYPELISAVVHVLTLLSAGDNRQMIWHYRQMGDRRLADKAVLTDYCNGLKRELESLGKQQLDSAEEFRALVNIDELVRSVTPDPLPAPDSEWSTNTTKLLDWLRGKATQSHVKVEIDELTGSYQSCLKHTQKNANVSVSSSQRSDQGQVLWTLRIWSSINGDHFPGRVIYVPASG